MGNNNPYAIIILEHRLGARPLKILIVDDDPEIQSLLRRGLVFEGYTVSVASDGKQALVTARDDPPDLVVLDVLMPEMDGFEVCQRLRQAGDVPILMLTAKDGITDRVRGLDFGADDYLVKPFAFDELLARIRALLR
jgi:two-component system response regulator MprA